MSDAAATSANAQLDLQKIVKDILSTIDRDREREIISRRFGLYDRKETLEQIGDLLGITRERVRQLEKAIMARLKVLAEDDLPHMKDVERVLVQNLHEMGRVARINELTERVSDNADERARAHVSFLATLAPNIAVVDENDYYHHAAGIAANHDDKQIKQNVDEIAVLIKEHGKPITAADLHAKTSHEHPDHVKAYASVSKKLATLNGLWGLQRWPVVNPKNIRDKIYVILNENGKPMHFSDIAKSIKESDFKRKDVTTQAIHNELIKDKRFVLIGRGIYALKEWGYSQGTVADVIADVLRKEGGPLHRDEIVKRVLKSRQVKETTILLNLQGKPQFKRVAKATYELAEAEDAATE